MHINELEAICSRQACHYHDLFQKIVTLTAEPLPGGQWLRKRGKRLLGIQTRKGRIITGDLLIFRSSLLSKATLYLP